MHCLNLGVALWVCGGILQTIVEDTSLWGTSSDVDDRYAIGYEHFRAWTRLNKIQQFNYDVLYFLLPVVHLKEKLEV